MVMNGAGQTMTPGYVLIADEEDERCFLVWIRQDAQPALCESPNGRAALDIHLPLSVFQTERNRVDVDGISLAYMDAAAMAERIGRADKRWRIWAIVMCREVQRVDGGLRIMLRDHSADGWLAREALMGDLDQPPIDFGGGWRFGCAVHRSAHMPSYDVMLRFVRKRVKGARGGDKRIERDCALIERN